MWLAIPVVALAVCVCHFAELQEFDGDSLSAQFIFRGRPGPRPNVPGDLDARESNLTGSGETVLCCWFCTRDQRQKCEHVSERFCNKWGSEVSSCSECSGLDRSGTSGQKSRREKADDSEQTGQSRKAQKATEGPKRKLAKPRVPYLKELAVDIDTALKDSVQKEPASTVSKALGEFQAATKSRDPLKEREAATRLGHAYYLTGQVGKSAEYYSKSAAISSKLGYRAAEGIDLRNLVAAYIAGGDFQQAERIGQQALQLLLPAGNSRDVQMAANNSGVLEKDRARYGQALDWYEAALTAREEPDNIRVLTLRNLGNFFKMWGEYGKAAENYGKAAEMSAQLGQYAEAGEIMLEAGQVYALAGSVDQAIDTMKMSLPMFAQANVPTDWSKKLMGDLLLDARRLDEAETLIKEADYDSSLGRFNLLKSQPQAALKAYEQLLSAAQKEENLDELFAAHTGLGKTFEVMKNYDRAQKHYSKAVETVEEIRSALLVSERKNFFSVKVSGFLRSEPAKGLVRLSLKQQKPDRSIYPSEATRAREFADNISQKADRRHFGVPPELIEQEAGLANKLAALKTAISVVPKSSDSRRWGEMTNEIKRASDGLTKFVRTLCERHADYCAVVHPSPVNLEKADIGPDEHVLMFDLVDDGVAIRLLKGRKILKAALVDGNPEEIENAIRDFRTPFEKVQLTKFNADLAALLHKRLTALVTESVPAGAPVVIIPDGVLALLPFEALVTGGAVTWKTGRQGDYPYGVSYLGDRNPIVYSQSLTTMTLIRRLAKKEKAGNAVIVMADPVFKTSDERVRDASIPKLQASDNSSARVKIAVEQALAGPVSLRRLKETTELGTILKKQFGESCEVLTGLQCTKGAFLNRISGNPNLYSHVVFGTHGFTANDFPGLMEPFLALTMVPEGIDGLLTMSDVAGLKMNADVATLLACNTGVGVRLAGEGVMSMGRSFQSAGARSVIMSLWSVAEKPSVLLVEEFFNGRNQGLGKLQAWARSRTELRKKGFEHPFFWASFILVGETD